MDLTALVAGSEHDFANERAERLGRFPAAVRVVQRLGEPDHVPAVDVADVGMHVGDVGRSLRQTLGDLRLLPLKLVHAGLHRRLVHPVLDRGHNAGDGALNLLKRSVVALSLRPPVMVQPVHLFRIGAHGFRHCLG